MTDTIYSQIISKFKLGALTPAQQSELDAIRSIADISQNDLFWIQFLPVYLLMPRQDDENLHSIELLEAIGSGKSKRNMIDQDALAKGIAVRLGDVLEDLAPNTDPVILAKAVAKAATPAIQQAVEDATTKAIQQPKIDLAPLQATINETMRQTQATMVEIGRDAFFNRHIAIMAAAGILMGIAGIWWGGHTRDLQWQTMFQQSQDEIKDLKAELKLSLGHPSRKNKG